jgi:hypothetical protein
MSINLAFPSACFLAWILSFNALAQPQDSERVQIKNIVNQIIEVAHIQPLISTFTSNIVLKLFNGKCELKHEGHIESCQQFLKDYDTELSKSLTSKFFLKPYQDSYESEFTLSELQQILSFHSSPVASKIKTRLNGLLSDSNLLDLQLINAQSLAAAIKNIEKLLGRSLESLIQEANAGAK